MYTEDKWKVGHRLPSMRRAQRKDADRLVRLSLYTYLWLLIQKITREYNRLLFQNCHFVLNCILQCIFFFQKKKVASGTSYAPFHRTLEIFAWRQLRIHFIFKAYLILCYIPIHIGDKPIYVPFCVLFVWLIDCLQEAIGNKDFETFFHMEMLKFFFKTFFLKLVPGAKRLVLLEQHPVQRQCSFSTINIRFFCQGKTLSRWLLLNHLSFPCSKDSWVTALLMHVTRCHVVLLVIANTEVHYVLWFLEEKAEK